LKTRTRNCSKPEKGELARKEELKNALKISENTDAIESVPREIAKYTSHIDILEEIKQRPVSWYEKACAISEKYIP
jgi:hypothetical protein